MERGINTKCLHLEEEEGCCNNYGSISFPIYQIDGVIASSSQADMKSMDNSLLELYRNRQITRETALKYSSNPEMLKRKLM